MTDFQHHQQLEFFELTRDTKVPDQGRNLELIVASRANSSQMKTIVRTERREKQREMFPAKTLH